jgi:hypothetical protein
MITLHTFMLHAASQNSENAAANNNGSIDVGVWLLPPTDEEASAAIMGQILEDWCFS